MLLNCVVAHGKDSCFAPSNEYQGNASIIGAGIPNVMDAPSSHMYMDTLLILLLLCMLVQVGMLERLCLSE